jgi:hypothetical protein
VMLESTLRSLRRSIAAIGLGALLSVGAGCGASNAGLSVTGLSPGTTAIRVANHVDDSYALERVVISVDGEAVPLSSVPPRGEAPAIVTALRLRPGAHTITVRAVARGKVDGSVVSLAHQSFHLAAGPAAILVDVRSSPRSDTRAAPASADGGDRVAVDLSIRGGSLGPAFGAAPAEDKDERCAPLLPIPRAICRAAVDLDAATRRRDAAAATCVQNKLGEMRRLALVAETSDSATGTMIEEEVTRLSGQADVCVGNLFGGPDGTRIIRPPPPPGVPTALR